MIIPQVERQKGSKPPSCEGCPLYNASKIIYPKIPENPTYIIVGEAPGREEVIHGTPFVGSSGKMLYKLTRLAGIRLSSAILTNTIWCRPPQNKLPENPKEREDLVKRCTKHFLFPLLDKGLFRDLPVLSCGAVALKALTGEQSITECAGYLLKHKDHTVVPIWHPAHIMKNRTLIPSASKIVEKILSPLPEDEDEYMMSVNENPFQLLSILEEAKPSRIVVDTETAGLVDLTMTAFGFALPDGRAFSMSATPQYRPVIEAVCNNPCLKVAHNVVFDQKVLRKNGYTLCGPWHDTTRTAHFAGNVFNHKLEHLAGVHLKTTKWKREANVEGLLTYNAKDCRNTELLYRKFRENMPDASWTLFIRTQDVEKVIADMNQRGFLVDINKLREVKQQLHSQLKAYEAAWHGVAPGIKPTARKKMAEFFMALGATLPRTPTGQFKLNKATLKKLATKGGDLGEAAQILLSYRKIHKVVTTYLDLPIQDDCRIHPNYNATGTVSGRFSSKNPNMQNFPHRDEGTAIIRSCFIPTPGHYLAEVDFSQAETRITAILANENSILEQEDMHTFIASKVFRIPESEVTKAQRYLAKTVVYAMSYGAQPNKVAQTAEITLSEAKALVSGFRKAFPSYCAMLDGWTDTAIQEGFLSNPFGRVFPFVTDRVATQSKNFIPQSTVADMINICLCDLRRKIKKEKLPIYPLLQIHDSVVVEIEEWLTPEKLVPIIHEVFEHPWPELRNKVIPVTVGVGYDWGSL